MNNLERLFTKVAILQIAFSLVIAGLISQTSLQCFSIPLLIGGLSSSIYTLLLSLANKYKILIFLGYPLRICIVGIPVALLVHKFNFNLLGLFTGLAISQLIYLIVVWRNLNKEI